MTKCISNTRLYTRLQHSSLLKLKAMADDNLNVAQNIKLVFHRMKNIVGKGENAG